MEPLIFDPDNIQSGQYLIPITMKERTRGKGLKKETWFSVCSRHQNHNETCNLCQIGYWEKNINLKTRLFFYKFCRPLWFWWVNRPNSATRKRLEELFPNLKK